jgi:hypothetical protein
VGAICIIDCCWGAIPCRVGDVGGPCIWPCKTLNLPYGGWPPLPTSILVGDALGVLVSAVATAIECAPGTNPPPRDGEGPLGGCPNGSFVVGVDVVAAAAVVPREEGTTGPGGTSPGGASPDSTGLEPITSEPATAGWPCCAAPPPSPPPADDNPCGP